MRWMTQSWLVGLVMIALVPSGANAQAVDPSGDGALKGALIGAGAGLGLVATGLVMRGARRLSPAPCTRWARRTAPALVLWPAG
jgi:hypothetical protein